MIRINGVANLTADPETVQIGEHTKVNFSVATNDPYIKDKDKSASYFDCEMWGKSAEAFAKYHAKGDKVYLVGRLVQDRWVDKETEKTRSKVKLKVEDFEFVKTRQATTEPQRETVPAEDIPF